MILGGRGVHGFNAKIQMEIEKHFQKSENAIDRIDPIGRISKLRFPYKRVCERF
jgi:hypothetical protein